MGKLGYIYCFTNLINNKKYIGQTINNDNARYSAHISNSNNSNSQEYDSLLHRAIRKYGIENFQYEILAKEIEDIEILNLLEIYYIKSFKTQAPDGYNLDEGGRNASKPKSQEQKVKLTWGQAELTEEEIKELRIAYANNESPKEIYDNKYKERLHYNSFLNIWSGRRYKNIMPELISKGRHTKLNQEKADIIRKIYSEGNTSYKKIAEQFEISPSTVSDIINNRTWVKNQK